MKHHLGWNRAERTVEPWKLADLEFAVRRLQLLQARVDPFAEFLEVAHVQVGHGAFSGGRLIQRGFRVRRRGSARSEGRPLLLSSHAFSILDERTVTRTPEQEDDDEIHAFMSARKFREFGVNRRSGKVRRKVDSRRFAWPVVK